jgi:hypothetical protein
MGMESGCWTRACAPFSHHWLHYLFHCTVSTGSSLDCFRVVSQSWQLLVNPACSGRDPPRESRGWRTASPSLGGPIPVPAPPPANNLSHPLGHSRRSFVPPSFSTDSCMLALHRPDSVGSINQHQHQCSQPPEGFTFASPANRPFRIRLDLSLYAGIRGIVFLCAVVSPMPAYRLDDNRLMDALGL